MKKIFSLLIILVSLKSFGQVYQVLPQYGYEMKRVDPTLVLKVPSDTTNNKTGIARIGTTLYVGNGTYWTAAAGGGGSGWDLSGNSITSGQYLGTNNVEDLVLHSGGDEVARFNAGGDLSAIFHGNVGIGVTTPTAKLHVLQSTPASVATTSVTATASPLRVIGGNGGATSSNGATVNAGNAGSIILTGGNGGAITGSPTVGVGGAGGNITPTAGDGGTGTTQGGNGGNFEAQGGNSGFGTAIGVAGYSAIKGGNAFPSGNGNGGNVFLTAGAKNGSGQDGTIFLGLSPSLVSRGNTVIGSATDDYTNKLQVTGGVKTTGGVTFTGLTSSANATDSIMVTNVATGAVGYRAIPSGGGISGLTTNYLTKATSSTTIGNSQLFDNGTNVGIGTATPSVKLDVVGRLKISQDVSVNNIFINGGNTTATGVNNNALGINTMTSLTTGNNNTALGFEALKNVADGIGNMAIGTQALYNTIDGLYNIGIGTQASFTQTSAPNNVAIGRQALYNNVSGNGNMALGTFALQNTTGSFNTALGLYSGQNLTSGGYNVAIGSWLDFPSATATGQLNIGNVLYGTGMYSTAASSSVPVSDGKIGIGTATPTTKLQVAGNFAAQQGADVASTAGAMTLGTDGNSFEITGTNSITLLSNVGWINGSEVTLMFTGAATLVNGTATSGTNIIMKLAGAVNFVATADDTITLVLGEIGGVQAWREKCRSIN